MFGGFVWWFLRESLVWKGVMGWFLWALLLLKLLLVWKVIIGNFGEWGKMCESCKYTFQNLKETKQKTVPDYPITHYCGCDFEAGLAISFCCDYSVYASDAFENIATDEKGYRKCSLCVILCCIHMINNSKKAWLIGHLWRLNFCKRNLKLTQKKKQ